MLALYHASRQAPQLGTNARCAGGALREAREAQEKAADHVGLRFFAQLLAQIQRLLQRLLGVVPLAHSPEHVREPQPAGRLALVEGARFAQCDRGAAQFPFAAEPECPDRQVIRALDARRVVGL